MPKYDPLVYSIQELEPIVVPVTLGNAKLELRQATPAVACRFQAAKLRNGRIEKDGSVVINDDGGENALKSKLVLVGGCAFAEGGTECLGESWAASLHPWVLDDLFDRAKAISRIDQDWDVARLKAYIAELQERLDEIESGACDPKK